ncbi:hypothetical protein [Marinospirillum perlucidum]|uniref:hypothetical protein n=1 Tax=Marinospirillum perlucidum TaxID=1982602 RepID=UPI000DF198AA|nr:hypothetical protein [Marinospirillum perlucidum]
MKKNIFAASALAATVALAGCASSPENNEPSLPSWIFMPEVQDGLAATSCVPASGRINSDSSRADLAARQQLATTMGAQIQSLTENYQRTIDTQEDGLATGGNFEEVTRQIVDQEMVGSRRVKAEYVTIEGQRQFCSMVAVGQESVTQMLQSVADAAGAEPDAFTTSQMREQFMSQRALNRLNEATE